MSLIPVTEICPACDGTGRRKDEEHACKQCRGAGKWTELVPLEQMADRVAEILAGRNEPHA